MSGLLPALMITLEVLKFNGTVKTQFLEAGQEVKNLSFHVLKSQFAMLWLCHKDRDLRVT